MLIYNSLTNKKEEFIPKVEKEVSMYVCGPTVYNYIHIGNARPIIFFDCVSRYLRYRGYNVKYVSNITDVDDKIIDKAISSNKTEQEISSFFTEQFLEHTKKLGSNKPDLMPKATDFIPQMISFISELIDKGYAYSNQGDVYFRVSKLKEYGLLSNQNTIDLEVGARINVNEKKENPLDFTLWKNTNVGIKWESPWGMGRPGWHTECVVMIKDIFKKEIDIHGGGNDLKFPHHENEIAQANACDNHHLASYWMHVGRLGINNDKMSKSLGNTIWVKDLLERIDYRAFRLFMFSSHYRQPINYTEETINQFSKEFEKIERLYLSAMQNLDLNDYFDNNVTDSKLEYSDDLNEFIKYMDDDFNTSNVLMVINNLVKKINQLIRSKADYIKELNSLTDILSVLGISIDYKYLSSDIKQIYKDMINAKSNKDFSKSDELRKTLIDKGLIL